MVGANETTVVDCNTLLEVVYCSIVVEMVVNKEVEVGNKVLKVGNVVVKDGDVGVKVGNRVVKVGKEVVLICNEVEVGNWVVGVVIPMVAVDGNTVVEVVVAYLLVEGLLSDLPVWCSAVDDNTASWAMVTTSSDSKDFRITSSRT